MEHILKARQRDRFGPKKSRVAEDKSRALQAIEKKKSSDFETTTPPISTIMLQPDSDKESKHEGTQNTQQRYFWLVHRWLLVGCGLKG